MSAAKEKYKLFALSYIVDGNAAQAAIKAGYSRKCARQQGTRLLANADIRKMIDEARAKAIAEAEEKALLSYREKREMLKRIVCCEESSVKDVLKAIEIDNDMAGDNARQRIDLTSGEEEIRPVIHFLRSGKGADGP